MYVTVHSSRDIQGSFKFFMGDTLRKKKEGGKKG
jgi:hypothetical protein